MRATNAQLRQALEALATSERERALASGQLAWLMKQRQRENFRPEVALKGVRELRATADELQDYILTRSKYSPHKWSEVYRTVENIADRLLDIEETLWVEEHEGNR